MIMEFRRKLLILGLFGTICVVINALPPQGIFSQNTDPNTVDVYTEILIPPPGDCQRKSKKTDILVLHYKGFFENGTMFDSSIDRPGAAPFQFQLGIGQVIQGWERGLLDMCVGEKRKLWVPYLLAYGEKGSLPVIPPQANLIFEAEMIQIHDGPKPPNVFKMIDIDNDQFLTKDEVTMYLARAAQQQGVPLDLAAKQQQQIMDKMFSFEDKDGDGKISHEEFNGPKHDEL